MYNQLTTTNRDFFRNTAGSVNMLYFKKHNTTKNQHY